MTAHRCAGGLKKKVDLRSGSQSHKHSVGFFKVPVQHQNRALLSAFPRMDPYMAEWDSSSQPQDDSYAASLDNGQIHCAKVVNTLGCLLRHARAHRGPIIKKKTGVSTRLVVLRIYVVLAIFQPYRDMEAGDNQSNRSGGTGNRTPDLLLKPRA